jgi:hypothetical protein
MPDQNPPSDELREVFPRFRTALLKMSTKIEITAPKTARMKIWVITSISCLHSFFAPSCSKTAPNATACPAILVGQKQMGRAFLRANPLSAAPQ